MNLTESEIFPIAEATGFDPKTTEKVIRLLTMLNALQSHPFLKGKLALKGGTALNLFIFDMPRLSVDIDLNYIGALNREEMLADRPKVEQALRAVFARENYAVKRMPIEHAGGKWRLSYQSFTGQPGNLEIDLNFMFRQPLWNTNSIESHTLGNYQATFPVLDIHELAAGKLAALFARHQARDLFDVHCLLAHNDLNLEQLRIAFIVYGALNRKDWRAISPGDIAFNPQELRQMLLPVLNEKNLREEKNMESYAKRLVAECKEKIATLFPYSDKEREFLNQLLDQGNIDPALLTDDPLLHQRIKNHPMLLWKAINVRRHFGLD